MLPKQLPGLCLIVLLSNLVLSNHVFAQGSKVVVVPMAGDDLHTQYVSIGEQTHAGFSGCESEIFSTPTRPTQVLAEARGSILLTSDHAGWTATPRFSQDGGSWMSFPVKLNSVAGGSANTWSFSTNAQALELQPNSEYQFRVDYFTAPAHANSICNLVLTFSYVQPDIVKAVPILAKIREVSDTVEATASAVGRVD